ncbi:MAG: hypothetical protein KAS32_24940 [Candidatus Peribacteraceae bacterium]|nr:hypothetical protein [Candidatus Peribacteraceae bacterium]
MLQDAHTKKTSIAVAAAVGTNTILAGDTSSWIYVHLLIGDLASAGNLIIRSGTTVLASFTLDAGQGLTEQDEPGNDNVPRFECPPGEDFILEVTGGTFSGSLNYSRRY